MSMLKKTIFLLILLSLVSVTTLPSNGCCDDWVYVGSNKACTLYYKSSTVKIDKQNKTIKFWVKNVWTEKGKIMVLENYDSTSKQKFADIKHDLALHLLDYKQWKSCTTHITVYSKSGNVILDEEYPSKWSDITPDTLEETLFNQILKDYKIQR
jgi:hypothetical protein